MSRRIIKDRAIVTDDWIHVGVGDAVPPAGAVIVPLALWRERQGDLAGRRVGVRLEPTDDPGSVDLDGVDLVAISFPKFTDGRGLSLARLLRQRHGYRGELRAVGDVLRDQLAFMARCGFDAFEVRADKNLDDALNAFGEITVTYQP